MEIETELLRGRSGEQTTNHFLFNIFCLRRRGLGRSRIKKAKEMVVGCTRVAVAERVPRRNQTPMRTLRVRITTRSARAISRQNPADFVRSTFELRPIHTARLATLYRWAFRLKNLNQTHYEWNEK